jgi:hypothetical protein
LIVYLLAFTHSGNNPFPYTIEPYWQRTTLAPVPGANIPIPLPGPIETFTITRDTTVAANNGWYKYTGKFTPSSAPNTLSQATFNIAFVLRRTLGQSASTNVWMDDVLIDYTNAVVVGDPQFVGLRGQSYQVHGIDGGVYNLVSSATTQVNSRFVFLDHGKCPMFNGIPAQNCWAHAGSYLGEIGVQQDVNGVTHKLKITAGASTTGFASVTVDDKVMSIGDDMADTKLFQVKYESSHQVIVHTADFIFTFDNSDMFINQAVSVNKPLSQLTAHGLFGQTHKRAVYASSVKYIAGEVDDYLVSENDLFGVHFMYNKYHADK